MIGFPLPPGFPAERRPGSHDLAPHPHRVVVPLVSTSPKLSCSPWFSPLVNHYYHILFQLGINGVLWNRILTILITHYPICVWFLTAFEELFKIAVESKQNDFRNVLSCDIKGIDMNCKDDGLNLNLYSKRTDLHSFPGEFTRQYLSQFS